LEFPISSWYVLGIAQNIMNTIRNPDSGSASELALEVREATRENLYACLDLLHRAISIESFSGKEEGMAALLMEYFGENRLPAFTTPRGSVVALLVPDSLRGKIPLPESKKSGDLQEWARRNVNAARAAGIQTLALNAHMDVVEPGDTSNWRFHPFRPTRDRGIIYGRGACDMKGALCAMAQAMTTAAQMARKRPLPRLIMGCFVTEEEAAEGLAFKEIIRDLGLRPDMVILGEPSKMEIARGQRGKLEMIIHGKGKRGHTSVPEVASNAAYKVARAVLAVEQLDKREFKRVGADPKRLLERSTLTVTSMQTIPLGTSSVPDKAQATVTVRLAEGKNFASIMTELENEFPDLGVDFELVTYRGMAYTGKRANWPSEHLAWQFPVEHPFFQFLQQSCRDILRREPKAKIWPFSTDGVYSAGVENIPTLGIGPGREETAHTVDEHVTMAELEDALALYLYVALVETELRA